MPSPPSEAFFQGKNLPNLSVHSWKELITQPHLVNEILGSEIKYVAHDHDFVPPVRNLLLFQLNW